MKHLIIDRYMTKVDRTDCVDGEYGKILHGEDRLYSSTDMGADSRTVAELRKSTKRFTRTYRGEVEKGVFKHDLGSYAGIKDYHLIYLKEV
jgi:hypothetical protein